MKDFITFIRQQGIVGLAIGFILGTSVNKVVASLVGDIIQPLIGLVFGSNSGLRGFSLGPVALGNFLSVLIDFIIIAAVVYFIFKKFKFDKLDTAKK